jgi:hypothetical protein
MFPRVHTDQKSIEKHNLLSDSWKSNREKKQKDKE